MNENSDVKEILSIIIKKQILIFGPTITHIIIRSIKGIEINTEGYVLQIKDHPKLVMQKLIGEFNQLSPYVVQNVIKPMYPTNDNSTGDFESAILRTENTVSEKHPLVPPYDRSQHAEYLKILH